MKIVIFGLTISSSWGNGHATLWRGLCRALAKHNHYVVFYEKPFVKFERLLETYLAFAPRGFNSFRMALPLWLKQKLFQKDLLANRLKARAPGFDWQNKLLFAEHHRSHAASAFYLSPFDEALILTMDGVGEWATTSVGVGRGHGIEMLKEITRSRRVPVIVVSSHSTQLLPNS